MPTQPVPLTATQLSIHSGTYLNVTNETIKFSPTGNTVTITFDIPKDVVDGYRTRDSATPAPYLAKAGEVIFARGVGLPPLGGIKKVHMSFSPQSQVIFNLEFAIDAIKVDHG